ncbi:MAG: protein kinase, partial [Myxococcota bacterium]|nr:protein kinase [Myxococcota bacterium]
MSTQTPPPPSAIGPYRVIRPLAKGGMASVYEVEDPETCRRLALKLLTHQGLAAPRFSREYRALTRLNHPNIVRVYRYGVSDDGCPFLTMELLDGVAAQVYAKSKGRPGTPQRTRECMRLIADVAEGLSYLHHRDIVHRDLKSANVLVMPDGTVKLVDLGTARLLGSTVGITRQGEFVGTFAYASPEQLTGGEVDARSDIYSLGVLLYRLLTGQRPFEADNPHDLAKLHLHQMPRPPQELVKTLPAGVSHLILRMMSKDPGHRPASAEAVGAALRSHFEDGAGSARSSKAVKLTHLVGRDAELRSLSAVLQRARPGRMTIISGPAGSGRSRLLQQTKENARTADWLVFEAVFPGASGLGGLVQVLDSICADGKVELRKVDRDVISQAPNLAATAGRAAREVGEVVSSIVLRFATGVNRKILLVLYDLHRASPLANQAVGVMRQRAAELEHPLVLIGTTNEQGDGPSSPLRQAYPDAHRIYLTPLTLEEVGQQVAAMLGRPSPPADLVRSVFDASGGMPGYVAEIVRAMVQAKMVTGSVGSEVPQTRRELVGRTPIPRSVREALGLRLAAVPRPAQRILEALAVSGVETHTSVLAFSVDKTEVEIRPFMEKLQEERIIVSGDVDGAEACRFNLGMTADLVIEK